MYWEYEWAYTVSTEKISWGGGHWVGKLLGGEILVQEINRPVELLDALEFVEIFSVAFVALPLKTLPAWK